MAPSPPSRLYLNMKSFSYLDLPSSIYLTFSLVLLIFISLKLRNKISYHTVLLINQQALL